ncbi:Protein of unknown function [Kytococcus aerolatus]|uniref:DUF3097 domain-containing protein n=1 Tax=Kytococcus aerolatus TaxID=592308 RepID=A0A212U294_9MICO|nr:DUF3097 domain-containing protein [Kytococcus aerolatus]SNC72377.1 Protein of unknown function [Kytococcus aerolatus]
MHDRYGNDVLAGDWKRPPRGRSREVEAVRDLVVEDVATGWVGAVVAVEKAGGKHVVHLEDAQGKVRAFPLGGGFWMDGQPVRLVAPKADPAPRRPERTASGSRAVEAAPARVAVGSRIFVEGKHDAELVEKVWGDDLRVEGVVVEMLDGVDDLRGVIEDFRPTADRRMGVLVDHLVPGTKEWRVVEEARRTPRYARHVRIVGHPYVDVWQSVRPERLGLEQWPVIPKGQSWKHGILAHLGWPHSSQADVARGWQRILASVDDYTHLEPELLGRVEELIDFVTVGDLPLG